MNINTCSLKSSYVKDNNKFFNYQIQFLNLFPTQLSNVLSIGEFYQIIDGVNSINMVKPHSYIIVLLQSIILYLLLQLMVVGNMITKLNCTIFFSLVLLHFICVTIIFIQCLYKSIKLKCYLSRLNKQFKDRNIKFKTQLEKDNNNNITFSFGFIGKVLFLLVPFLLQLEILYGKNQSVYLYSVCYIIITIFSIFIFNIFKQLLLFTKFKSFFFGDKDIDLGQLFFIESIIISYKSTSISELATSSNNNNNNNNNHTNYTSYINNSPNNKYNDDEDLIVPDYNESTSLLDFNV